MQTNNIGITLFIINMSMCVTSCVHAKPPAALPPASTAPADWKAGYAEVRQEWFDYFKAPSNGLTVKHWRQHEVRAPADYIYILRRYEWAVYGSWKERGELRYIVVDEDGKPVTDATREMREFVKLGSQ